MNKDIQKWLAETLQEAFPGIPIYTGETMDNEHERNEHFKGFAELLWHEVRKTSFDSPGFSHYQQLEKHLQLLFAQRAYDLAAHVIDHLSSYTYDTATSGQDLWNAIPDLTAWPKTASE